MFKMFKLFGFSLQTDFPFKTFLPPASGTPDISFQCALQPPQGWVGQASNLLYASPVVKEQVPLFAIHRSAQYDLLTFADIAHFYVGTHDIVCHLLKPEYQYLVEIRFMGPVMSHWLEIHGFTALHAAAVMLEGKAVAFVAPNQGGKTSLTAAFLQAGHPLLTDDILPVQVQHNQAICHPGYPQMRLWPDQITRLFKQERTANEFDRVHPDYEKVRVPVCPDVLGEFYQAPAKLAMIYLLARVDPNESQSKEVAFTAVPTTRGVFELARASFSRHAHHLPNQQSRLEQLGFISRNIPIRRLTYPSGYELLPTIREAVLADVNKGHC